MLAMLCAGAAALGAQTQRARAESNPDWAYSPPSASKSVEIGNFYFRKKDYRGALSRFEEAVHTNPDYAPAYLGLGKVYEKTGRKKDALKAYEKYLDELPSDEDAARAKSAHKAIERLKSELARSPRSAPKVQKSFTASE